MAHVYVDSNAVGAGTGADWANAYTSLAAAMTGSAVAGNQYWVAHDHNFTEGATKTLTSPGTGAAPCTVICVNKAGSVPPVAADFATTAIEETTGSFGITFSSGHTYWHGIIFNCGTGAGTASFTVSTNSRNVFKSCAFNMIATGNSSRFILGSSSGDSSADFFDCSFRFSSSFQNFAPTTSVARFFGGTIGATGTIPSALMGAATRPAPMLFYNVDMSNFTTGSSVCATGYQHHILLKNCKIGSGFSRAPTTPQRGANVVVENTSHADINYELAKYAFEGQHETSIIVKRTSGFSDGTTGLSQRFTTSSGASVYWPFEGLPIAAWHDSEGANITVTVEGVADPRHFSALPTNAEFWLDLDYFGTSGNPLGVIKSGGPATPMTAGSAYSASTEAWDTGATARAHSTLYAAGDVIKLASNSGRIFICTTGGTTDGSEPAGYASAVDGGSVTDGTATFKAGWRFKAVVTTTAAPQNKGPIYVTPKMAKASSVLYMDPKLLVA